MSRVPGLSPRMVKFRPAGAGHRWRSGQISASSTIHSKLGNRGPADLNEWPVDNILARHLNLDYDHPVPGLASRDSAMPG